VFSAWRAGDPAPHPSFLPGMRVCNAAGGPPGPAVVGDRCLELTAEPEEIRKLCAKLACATDGRHTHFYAFTLETDDS
jgi:hypothetical protein